MLTAELIAACPQLSSNRAKTGKKKGQVTCQSYHVGIRRMRENREIANVHVTEVYGAPFGKKLFANFPLVFWLISRSLFPI